MKHRWERRSDARKDDVSVCVNCGFIKSMIDNPAPNRRRGNYPQYNYERGMEKFNSNRTPKCDGVWPDDWKPNRRYAMFLDDIRNPPVIKGTLWIVVRSFDEAVAYIARFGMPTKISFDHDLGDDVPTGHDLAKWLVNRHLDEIDLLPAAFSYVVHSANSPGAENIRGLLDNFIQFLAVQNRNDVL